LINIRILKVHFLWELLKVFYVQAVVLKKATTLALDSEVVEIRFSIHVLIVINLLHRFWIVQIVTDVNVKDLK